jgi:DNA primase
MRAADKAMETTLAELGIKAFEETEFLVAVIPGGQDPAELCASSGSAAMQDILDTAVPLLRYCIDRRISHGASSTPEARARSLNSALSVLIPFKDSLIAADYLNDLADSFQIDYGTAKATLLRLAGASPGTSARTSPRAEDATGGESLRQAPSEAAPDAPKDNAPLTRAAALERELVICLVGMPGMRLTIAEALDGITFSDGAAGRIAELVKSDPSWQTARPDALAARVIDAMPEAASVLGAGHSVSDGDDQSKQLLRLISLLKAEHLEMRVKALNRRHKKLLSQGSPEADEAFEAIMRLQQELSDIRKSLADFSAL